MLFQNFSSIHLTNLWKCSRRFSQSETTPWPFGLKNFSQEGFPLETLEEEHSGIATAKVSWLKTKEERTFSLNHTLKRRLQSYKRLLDQLVYISLTQQINMTNVATLGIQNICKMKGLFCLYCLYFLQKWKWEIKSGSKKSLLWLKNHHRN